jgi:outer membrane protein assembly factor BamB
MEPEQAQRTTRSLLVKTLIPIFLLLLGTTVLFILEPVRSAPSTSEGAASRLAATGPRYLPLVFRNGPTLPSPFELAPAGCPMAHCDGRMSDIVSLPPPAPGAQLIWHDPVTSPAGTPFGSSRGLGCSGNGRTAACSFGRLPPDFENTRTCDPAIRDTVVVYGYGDGNGSPTRLWSSGTLLNCTAFASVPMISSSGEIIAADNRRLVRFSADGRVIWDTAMTAGIPVSPVPLDNGLVVTATFGGPISAYDSRTGSRVGMLDLASGTGRFHTANTPAVRGNRIYVSTEFSESSGTGRLYAIDAILPAGYNPLDPSTYDPTAVLRVVWHVDFGGPSGASPLVVGDQIFFDGDRPFPDAPFAPHVFAVRDLGSSGQKVWARSMGSAMRASFAQDPRGGLWLFTAGTSSDENKWLIRLVLEDSDGDGVGEVVERIDLDALVAEPGVHLPSSALSIAGTARAPVMLVGATAFAEGGTVLSTYVTAIDLNGRSLLWKVQLPSNFTQGQFPILQGAHGPRVFFTNQDDGLWVIGQP